jgi:serine/threonine protein kinase
MVKSAEKRLLTHSQTRKPKEVISKAKKIFKISHSWDADEGHFDLSAYDKCEVLGKGGQGSVIKVINKTTGQVFALKVYFKKQIEDKTQSKAQVRKLNRKQEKCAKNEYERLMKCSHPNVIKTYGFTVDEQGNWCILMEFCEQGCLVKFYRDRLKNSAEPEDKDYGLSPKEFSIQNRFVLVK